MIFAVRNKAHVWMEIFNNLVIISQGKLPLQLYLAYCLYRMNGRAG